MSAGDGEALTSAVRGFWDAQAEEPGVVVLDGLRLVRPQDLT